jgi:hypothetical protein
MDRVCTIGVVDKAYDRLRSFAHHKSRTRRHAIITNQSGGTKVRVHLLGERLDVNLIVVDRWTIGESELPWMLSVWKVSDLYALQLYSLQRLLDGGDGQRVLVKIVVCWAVPVLGSGELDCQCRNGTECGSDRRHCKSAVAMSECSGEGCWMSWIEQV